MSSFEIKQATRQGIIPLISVHSESGCGKSMSSLLLARGFVGPAGKIGMLDTENRRGSLYADVIPGGYNVLDLGEPFTPARYIEAWEALVKWGADIIVTDSMSHEHEGMGGILDMAAANEEKSGRPGLHNWKGPKMEHAKMMQWLLRSPVPMIFCIRAKYKTRQKKDDKGKTVIVKDEITSPIQAEDFIFEQLIAVEILPKHNIIQTKISHPDLRACLPADNTTPIESKHGALIAEWCRAGGSPRQQPATTPSAPNATKKPDGDDPRKPLVKKLWELLKDVRGSEPTWVGAETWLQGHKIIGEQKVRDLSLAELTVVLEKSELTLNPPN